MGLNKMTRTRLRDHERGSFRVAEHHEFIRDSARVDAFKNAIEKSKPQGKTVLDIGTGSGLLAIMAAKAGAKKVIAIEKDPMMAEIALENIRRQKLSDVVKVLVSDVFMLRPGNLPPADLILCEMFSTWGVEEPALPALRHVLSLMNEQAQTIPKLMTLRAQAVEANFRDNYDLVEVKTPFFDFDNKSYRAWSKELEVGKVEIGPRMKNEIDLEFELLRTVRVGTVNALRLTSHLHLMDDIIFASTHSLMPPIIVPLPVEIPFRNYQWVVGFMMKYEFGAGWDHVGIAVR